MTQLDSPPDAVEAKDDRNPDRAGPARREIPAERPRAPLPTGLISGKRTAWRRALSRATASVNRILDVVPPVRWLHDKVCASVEFTDVPVQLRRGGDGLHGLRIAFVSDIHAGSFLGERDLCRIFERINAAEPDIVCLGGDLINTRDRELLLFRRALSLLTPPLGVYAVPGNHDHFWGADIGLWEAFLQEHGVEVLTNRGMRLQRGGASFWIAGVDDLTEGEPDLRRAIEAANDNEPVVLLAHHPDFFFEAAAVQVDLTLSGHTHGGQIRFGRWAPLNHSKFDWLQGSYAVEESQLYVSRGVGVTFLPIRIGAPAEIPIVELRVR